MKICTVCHLEKKNEDFTILKTVKSGRAARCKKCAVEYNKYKKNKDPEKYLKKQAAYRKKHYEINKEKILISNKIWRDKNIEKVKLYQKEYAKQFYLNNKKKILQRNLVWKSDNREKVNEISKEQEQLIEIYNEIVDQKEQEKKVLFYDIEVGPNVVYSWRIGNKVNLSTDTIISERQILCISYKWRGDSKVHSLTWNGSDDKELMIKFAAIMNTADEVIGHNSDKYDVKFVRTRCLVHGVPLNVKFNQLDTLKFARAGFAFNSNKLDYISQYLGLGAKIKTDFQLWKDVLNGSKEALDRMVKYCNQDVLVLEKVYETLQPYSPRKKFKLLKSNGS